MNVDLAKTIAPKSDQLNADDLIAGPITITVTEVRGSDDPDQPIAICFEGDNRKPYKPCKSMRRVLVHCWGREGGEYPGRRMTLHRDENVMFGGIKVGGIRISHLSHIDREIEMALTVTKARRAPYRVKPLRAEVRDGPRGARADRRAEPQREQAPADDGFAGGFGGGDAGETMSAAVEWMLGVHEDLAADPPVFKSTADLNAFMADPDNRRKFAALKAEDPEMAKRLDAALTGRGKALVDRERSR